MTKKPSPSLSWAHRFSHSFKVAFRTYQSMKDLSGVATDHLVTPCIRNPFVPARRQVSRIINSREEVSRCFTQSFFRSDANNISHYSYFGFKRTVRSGFGPEKAANTNSLARSDFSLLDLLYTVKNMALLQDRLVRAQGCRC